MARTALAARGLPTGDSILHSYPNQLSGGMRQRACMAMAISCGSPLLIADEPTTALDVTIQAQILRLLLDLRAELGVAQILITHNVGVAAQTCDRVAVMYAGTVVEQGTASEVLKNSRHPYTRRSMSASPTARQLSSCRRSPARYPTSSIRPRAVASTRAASTRMDVCVTVKPEPTTISGAHWVACHWAAEQLAKSTEVMA